MEISHANTPIAIASRRLAFALVRADETDKWDTIDDIQGSLNDLSFAIVDEILHRLGRVIKS